MGILINLKKIKLIEKKYFGKQYILYSEKYVIMYNNFEFFKLIKEKIKNIV